MMDHDEIPKGSFPDTLKAEDIPDRYILRGPPTGQVVGAFNTFQLGFLWKIPNAESSGMLKAVAPDKYIEEQIFFEQNFEKNPKVALPMKLTLYKVSNSPDLHLRAVYSAEADDADEDVDNGLGFLRSKYQVLGASIVNENGKPLLDEKLSRSYMCIGQRFWELTSIISAKEFGKSDLVTADGSLLFRITFGNEEVLTSEYFFSSQVNVSIDQLASSQAENESKGQENSKEKLDGNAVVDEDLNLLSSTSIDVATIGLDPIPYHLATYAKIGKFTDGIVHIIDEKSGQTVDLQVHRVVLAARSPYFEAEFEANPRVVINKYAIPCMKTAVDYMYSNQLKSQDFNLLSQLIHIAEELQISGLKSKCLNGLVDCPLEIPQALSMFKLGMKFNSAVLRVHAHDFLIKLKGKIGIHTDDFKTFMAETDTKVLFEWLIN